MKAALIGLALAAALPAAAWADTGVDSLEKMTCPKSGAIDPTDLRWKLIEAEKIPLTQEMMKLIGPPSTLGEAARKQVGADKGPLLGLATDTLRLLQPDILGRPAAKGHPRPAMVSGETAPADAPARMVAFLDGDTGWLKIDCVYDPDAKDKSRDGGDDKGGKDGGDEKKSLKLIIGKQKSDVLKGDPKGSGFATFALASKDGDTTISSNIALGVRQPIDGPFTPMLYAEYDRKTAAKPKDEINNVIVGGDAIFSVGGVSPLAAIIDAGGAWQTDDHGRASVWNGSASATFSSFCNRHDPSKEGWHTMCWITATADYVHVDDPGDNTKWATQKNYGRAGADVEFDAQYVVPDGPTYTTSLTYKSRFRISGDGGEAKIASLALNFKPAKQDHFSVELSYSKGKDIASLADVDTLALSLGYRQ